VQEHQEQVLIYDRIAANRRKTFLLLIGFLVLVFGTCTVIGLAWGLPPGLSPIIFIVVLAFAVFSYFGSAAVALAVSGAKPVAKEQEPQLFRVVENLCIGAGLPMPRVYVIEDGSMNAFATGRDPKHASVAITRGLLDKLEYRELEGVMAHELSHVGNRDTMLMTTLVVLVGSLALVCDLIFRMTLYGAGSRGRYKDNNGGSWMLLLAVVLAVVTPIIARIITLAVSRQREYLADASGALLTRYPDALASALEKIRGDTDPLDAATKATSHLYFVNPLTDHASKLNDLFATHPPIEERIRLLRAM
jgi:heat shock protein HtpX